MTYFATALDLWRIHPDEDSDGSHKLALGNRLAALLMLVGDYRQAESLSRKILDEASVGAQPKARAHMLGRLGRALYMRGLNDQARKVLREALQLAETVGDDARMAAVYRDLGDVEFTSGTLPAAVDAYEKGRQIASQSATMRELPRHTRCFATLLIVQETSTTQYDTARWRWNRRTDRR